jgi:hypothetical protein
LSMLWMKLVLLLVLCSTLKYYCLLCQVCCEDCSTSWNSWHSDTSHRHHSFLVPVWILTGIPSNKRYCLDSILLATLLLWSQRSTVRPYAVGYWIITLTLILLPKVIFRTHFSTND